MIPVAGTDSWRRRKKPLPLSRFDSLPQILKFRGSSLPKETAIMTLDSKGKQLAAISWEKIKTRAEKVAHVLHNHSGLYREDRVALVFKEEEVVDFVVALMGCIIAGVTAVPVVDGLDNLVDMNYILSYSRAHIVLTTEADLKFLQKTLAAQKLSWPRGVEWWKIDTFGSYHARKNSPDVYQTPAELSYIEFSKGPTGEYRGVAISHKTIMHQMYCISAILSSKPAHTTSSQFDYHSEICHLNSASGADIFLSYLDTRNSIGLVLGVLYSIYNGNVLLWMPHAALSNPGLYAHIITKYCATHLLSDYPGLKQVAFNYQSFPLVTRNFSKKLKVNLSNVKWCLIDCLTVDSEFNEMLSDRWFKPLGHSQPRNVPAPMLSLSENGGMFISVRDWIGKQEILGCPVDSATAEDESAQASDLSELLLQRSALLTNTIKILSDCPQTMYEDSVPDSIRVGAFGFPIPDATIAVVDPETRNLVPSMAVGEIWVDSPSLSGGFWGMDTATMAIFRARIKNSPEYEDVGFLRTGLLGFIYYGKIYILGLYEDRLRQRLIESKYGEVILRNEYQYFYSTHLAQTIIRSVPSIYDCASFDIYLNEEYYPVLIIESPLAITTPLDNTEKPLELDDNALRSVTLRVMYCLKDVHKIQVYCIMVVEPDSLSRTIRNGRRQIGNMLCKRKYEMGNIPAVYIRFFTDQAMLNVAVGPDINSSIFSREVSQLRLEYCDPDQLQISSLDNRPQVHDEHSKKDLTSFRTFFELIQFRVKTSPESTVYTTIDSRCKESKTWTWKRYDNKIAQIAMYMRNKARVKAGDRVILIYTHSDDFALAVHACMALGAIAIPLSPFDIGRLSEDVPAFLSIISDYKVSAIFVNSEIDSHLKDKRVSSQIKQSAKVLKLAIPKTYNTSKPPKYSGNCMDANLNGGKRGLTDEAIVWVYWNADHRRTAVTMTNQGLLGVCKVQKTTFQMKNHHPLLACVRSTVGLGFIYTCLLGAYLGVTTYLLSPLDFANTPMLLYLAASRYKVCDLYATPQMIEHSLRSELAKSINLKPLKNFMISYDLRPNLDVYKKARAAFGALGLESTAMVNVYSHVLNPMISTRSYMAMEPIELWLDRVALRQGLVRYLQAGSTVSALRLQDSGMVPVQTQIAIVNPETRKVCCAGELGEIWVSSEGNVAGFYKSTDIFDSTRMNGIIIDEEGIEDESQTYMRTADLGFLHKVTRPIGPNGSEIVMQALFVVGSIAESFELFGLNHFPRDIEATIEQSHKCICREGSAIYLCAGKTVVIVEINRKNYLPSVVPSIVNNILDKHQLMTDIVVLVPAGKFPKSRLGEKQRGKTLHYWMKGKLPILQQFDVTS
ncbi:hypothetical protein CANCADRAFT_57077 [Tortispora caseinolytica NRRL Y-17796]|uniref:AMP-dependent synthetase/ligase domain-containing protein n=1 Tax=Tortispora caseinolytica NRRL Y-17796 TaxID=767744 RepID=A0A1E4TFQ5_9ASCO|nr:hypothetical protein CANCADRAFT_57077 [Tortispora caseinolytica NRRL Y-17796]